METTYKVTIHLEKVESDIDSVTFTPEALSEAFTFSQLGTAEACMALIEAYAEGVAARVNA